MAVELTIVDDPGDERFAQFRLNERGLASRTQKRDDAGAGLFLAEGDLVVERALDAGCRPTAALIDAERIPPVATRLAAEGASLYGGADEVRRIVWGLGIPQNVLALFERPARPSVAELAARCRRLVVLEGVDNPVNVGSAVRNAAGLSWDGLVLDHTSADPLARRALRVAMGTAFTLPHARTTDLPAALAELAATGVELYAMTPSADARDLGNVHPGNRLAVLIGSERAGLTADLLALAQPVQIPMSGGVDSLNAAAATAIACWALRP